MFWVESEGTEPEAHMHDGTLNDRNPKVSAAPGPPRDRQLSAGAC
jgi:hypothetical protein